MKIQENGDILLTLIELQSIAIHCENIGLLNAMKIYNGKKKEYKASEDYISKILKKGTILEK